ncbi:hypothetical protein TSOC_015235, partial [Tetrabaena socialis]
VVPRHPAQPRTLRTRACRPHHEHVPVADGAAVCVRLPARQLSQRAANGGAGGLCADGAGRVREPDGAPARNAVPLRHQQAEHAHQVQELPEA